MLTLVKGMPDIAVEIDRTKALLRRFELPLLQFASRITGDRERARDIVQETFIEFERRGPVSQNGEPVTWLFTVCRNRALNVCRKERRMSFLEDDVMEARLRELHAEAALHSSDRNHAHKEGGPFETMPRPASAILTADFNFRADDPLHARITFPYSDGTPAYRDAWQVRHGDRPQDHTLGVHDHEQWPEAFACDFIFLTEDIAGRVEEVAVNLDTDASDHQPVLLRLKD